MSDEKLPGWLVKAVACPASMMIDPRLVACPRGNGEPCEPVPYGDGQFARCPKCGDDTFPVIAEPELADPRSKFSVSPESVLFCAGRSDGHPPVTIEFSADGNVYLNDRLAGSDPEVFECIRNFVDIYTANVADLRADLVKTVEPILLPTLNDSVRDPELCATKMAEEIVDAILDHFKPYRKAGP